MAKSKPKNVKKITRSTKAKRPAVVRSKPKRKLILKKATPKKAMQKQTKKTILAKNAKSMTLAQKERAAAQKVKDHEQKVKDQVEGRKRTNVNISNPEDVKTSIDSLLVNTHAVEYLKKNVSKMSVDVISMLVTPKTDEYIAEQLGMKINAIRRILNIMQGYGITNYYISKNTKGWLSFAWYINTSKLTPFLEYVDSMDREKSIVTEACNDYFVCESCYSNDRFVFTFDSAFENNFKCSSCGKNLDRMNREEAQVLINKINGT